MRRGNPMPWLPLECEANCCAALMVGTLVSDALFSFTGRMSAGSRVLQQASMDIFKSRDVLPRLITDEHVRSEERLVRSCGHSTVALSLSRRDELFDELAMTKFSFRKSCSEIYGESTIVFPTEVVGLSRASGVASSLCGATVCLVAPPRVLLVPRSCRSRRALFVCIVCALSPTECVHSTTDASNRRSEPPQGLA